MEIKNFHNRKNGFLNEKLPRLVASELFGSAVCNLNCSYCYIPKNDKMKKHHEEILKALDTDKFLDNLKLMYGENLTDLALWGTEPTLVLDRLQKNFKKYINAFPKLKSFSFSTNFVAYENRIEDFLIFLSELDKEFSFKFQISIDGPEWVTDKFRGKDVTKRILANLELLIAFLNKTDLKKAKLSLAFKATVGNEMLQYMNENPDKLDEWYKFSYKLYELGQSITNKNVKRPSYSLSSLVVPGKYTTEQGKQFGEYVLNVRNYWNHTDIKDSMPLIKKMPTLNAYTYRFNTMIQHIDSGRLLEQPASTTCSGLDTQCAIDLNGDIMPCHRLILFNDKEYVDSIKADKAYMEDWNVSGIHEGILKNIKKFFMPNIHVSSERAFDRYAYVSNAVHQFSQFRITTATTMIRELADTGQIDPAYMDITLATLLSTYLNTVNSCPVENYLNTGSWLLNLVSMVRLFGNGAFQNIMDEFMDISPQLGGLDYGSNAVHQGK